MPPDISIGPLVNIIIPLWGDDAILGDLRGKFPCEDTEVEWIVAAVAPGDCCRRLSESKQILLVECPQPSRGSQLNAGATHARGSLLCFHHADTQLTKEHIDSLKIAAADQTIAGGAFLRQFDDRHVWLKFWQDFIHRHGGSWGPLLGDQSIFVRAEVFHNLGGFAEIPIMEDLDFSKRLRKAISVNLLDPPILSSPRRSAHLGSWKTTFINLWLILLFHLGVSPVKIHRWYYRWKEKERMEKPVQQTRE